MHKTYDSSKVLPCRSFRNNRTKRKTKRSDTGSPRFHFLVQIYLCYSKNNHPQDDMIFSFSFFLRFPNPESRTTKATFAFMARLPITYRRWRPRSARPTIIFHHANKCPWFGSCIERKSRRRLRVSTLEPRPNGNLRRPIYLPSDLPR